MGSYSQQLSETDSLVVITTMCVEVRKSASLKLYQFSHNSFYNTVSAFTESLSTDLGYYKLLYETPCCTDCICSILRPWGSFSLYKLIVSGKFLVTYLYSLIVIKSFGKTKDL